MMKVLISKLKICPESVSGVSLQKSLDWGRFSNVALNHVDNGISIAAACESTGPHSYRLSCQMGFWYKAAGGGAGGPLTKFGGRHKLGSGGSMQMNMGEINLNGGLARPGKTTEVGMKLGAKKFPNKTKERGDQFWHH